MSKFIFWKTSLFNWTEFKSELKPDHGHFTMIFRADLARYCTTRYDWLISVSLTSLWVFCLNHFSNSLKFRRSPFQLDQWSFGWNGNVEGFAKNYHYRHWANYFFLSTCDLFLSHVLSNKCKMPENRPQRWPWLCSFAQLWWNSWLLSLLISDRKRGLV